tara:strand:+ start:109 stop:390 length:282 start_codon:yes stop_codon:yes gene_type:complete
LACPEFTTTGTLTGLTTSYSCVCQEGFYKDMSDDGGESTKAGTCKACPTPETNCTGSIGLTLITLSAAPGYYRESNQTANFYQCDTFSDCQGE